MPMLKQPLTIEHALLGFIREGPVYGYEIHQRLLASEELGLVWNLKQSMVYALLARLEDDGYLTSMRESQGVRPARKVLHLTAQGAAAFDAWMRTPIEHGRDFRLEFLAKLYFAQREGSHAAHELLASQRQASVAWLADLNARAGALEDERPYDWLVLRYRAGQIAAALEWLDLCAEWLRDSPGAAAEQRQ